jgi:sugar O-acyltransferase (sialic acid O-acetyltransferase NeuD family)
MKPLIIFGTHQLSSLAWHCLTHDLQRPVVGFTVDQAFCLNEHHEGLPLVPFEQVEKVFNPAEYEMLLPLGWTKMNALRGDRCAAAKEKGYQLASYMSSRASLWPDTIVGEHCLIYEGVILQSFVQLGNNVIVRCGANIGHHTVIGDHCFIAASVVTGGGVKISPHCFIGLGAVIKNRVRLGEGCFIGAGAVVIADTEPGAVYVGNPARKLAKSAMDVTGG